MVSDYDSEDDDEAKWKKETDELLSDLLNSKSKFPKKEIFGDEEDKEKEERLGDMLIDEDEQRELENQTKVRKVHIAGLVIASYSHYSYSHVLILVLSFPIYLDSTLMLT